MDTSAERSAAALKTQPVKECCKVADNLEVTEQRQELIVRTCRVCHCRHFRLDAEHVIDRFKNDATGTFNVKGTPTR